MDIKETAKLDDIREGTFSLESLSAIYTQDPDCTEDQDGECQVLKLETVSNGTGSFLRLSLPNGGNWSFDSEDEMIALIRDFTSRYVQKEWKFPSQPKDPVQSA